MPPEAHLREHPETYNQPHGKARFPKKNVKLVNLKKRELNAGQDRERCSGAEEPSESPDGLLQMSRAEFDRALLEAAGREVERIGQEMHDHLCQHLLGAAFAAQALANSLPPGSPAALEARDVAQLINSAVQQTRDIVQGLHSKGVLRRVATSSGGGMNLPQST